MYYVDYSDLYDACQMHDKSKWGVETTTTTTTSKTKKEKMNLTDLFKYTVFNE